MKIVCNGRCGSIEWVCLGLKRSSDDKDYLGSMLDSGKNMANARISNHASW